MDDDEPAHPPSCRLVLMRPALDPFAWAMIFDDARRRSVGGAARWARCVPGRGRVPPPAGPPRARPGRRLENDHGRGGLVAAGFVVGCGGDRLAARLGAVGASAGAAPMMVGLAAAGWTWTSGPRRWRCGGDAARHHQSATPACARPSRSTSCPSPPPRSARRCRRWRRGPSVSRSGDVRRLCPSRSPTRWAISSSPPW